MLVFMSCGLPSCLESILLPGVMCMDVNAWKAHIVEVDSAERAREGGRERVRGREIDRDPEPSYKSKALPLSCLAACTLNIIKYTSQHNWNSKGSPNFCRLPSGGAHRFIKATLQGCRMAHNEPCALWGQSIAPWFSLCQYYSRYTDPPLHPSPLHRPHVITCTAFALIW